MMYTLDLPPIVRDQVFIEKAMGNGGTLLMIHSGTWLYRFRIPLTFLLKVL